MARMLSYSATALDAGERLDSLLAARACFASRSAAARAIESGNVFVNGANVVKKYAVAAGDVIVYQEEEEVEAGPVTGQPIDLDIRFEDDDLIVLSKQIGLVCHPSVDHADGTLVNALIYHCGADHLCNVQGEDDRLGIVHRLDRDTSGLMLAAKTDAAGYALMEDIRDRAVDRHYLALVHGVIAPDTGMIDAPIARNVTDRTRMAVSEDINAKSSITTFSVLERFEAGLRDEGYTLLECHLYTGRTHQSRVHMAYTRHPVVGDPLYGRAANAKARNRDAALKTELGLDRQFLHSYRLQFEHPVTHETLTFRDALPDDLQEVLDVLAERSMGRTSYGHEILD